MLFRTVCTYCNSSIEIARVRMGQMIKCPRCDREFLAQPATVEDAVIEMGAPEPLVPRKASSAPRTTGPATKHHLTLPPPPPEEWNASRDDEDEESATQRYRRFRPHPKDIEEFLDPDIAGGDLSWLMTAGLVIFALMLLVFLMVLVYVLIMH